MAKYLIDSTDIEIEEVSGTENLKLNLADGNSVEQMIGDLSNLSTTNKSNLVNALNEVNQNQINSNTYSTTETVVGIWFGKPLYRKVVARNQTVTNGTNISISNLNIDELVKIDGKHVNNSDTYTNNFFDSSDLKITLHENNNNIVVWTQTGQNYTSTIWIEYTKN